MSKPSLLLLHGALGSEKQLLPLKNLLEEFFHVEILTFSGHGGQPVDEVSFDMETFSNDVVAFLKANNIPKTSIFGFSMGGYVAFHMAKHHPDLVEKIFTLGTKLDWSPATAEKETKMLDANKIAEKVPAFANILEERHSPEDWKIVLQKTAEMMINLGNGAALTTDNFKNIHNQVTIGIGEEDNMVSLSESENVAFLLPNGTLQIFKGFKHPIEQVDLEVLAEQIRVFIG